MKCDDVDRALSEEPRLPLQAQEHVKSCTRCQQLVERAQYAGCVGYAFTSNSAQIAEGIATNLSPVTPDRPGALLFHSYSLAFLCPSSLLVSTTWERSPSR